VSIVFLIAATEYGKRPRRNAFAKRADACRQAEKKISSTPRDGG
jgi:hypothetical protein